MMEVSERCDLIGRMARCYCGQERPSSMDLPFFEYRGPGSREAKETCKCGYYKMAHATPTTKGFMHVCENFTLRGPNEFDSFYCGCRGFD